MSTPKSAPAPATKPTTAAATGDNRSRHAKLLDEALAQARSRAPATPAAGSAPIDSQSKSAAAPTPAKPTSRGAGAGSRRRSRLAAIALGVPDAKAASEQLHSHARSAVYVPGAVAAAIDAAADDDVFSDVGALDSGAKAAGSAAGDSGAKAAGGTIKLERMPAFMTGSVPLDSGVHNAVSSGADTAPNANGTIQLNAMPSFMQAAPGKQLDSAAGAAPAAGKKEATAPAGDSAAATATAAINYFELRSVLQHHLPSDDRTPEPVLASRARSLAMTPVEVLRAEPHVLAHYVHEACENTSDRVDLERMKLMLTTAAGQQQLHDLMVQHIGEHDRSERQAAITAALASGARGAADALTQPCECALCGARGAQPASGGVCGHCTRVTPVPSSLVSLARDMAAPSELLDCDLLAVEAKARTDAVVAARMEGLSLHDDVHRLTSAASATARLRAGALPLAVGTHYTKDDIASGNGGESARAIDDDDLVTWRVSLRNDPTVGNMVDAAIRGCNSALFDRMRPGQDTAALVHPIDASAFQTERRGNWRVLVHEDSSRMLDELNSSSSGTITRSGVPAAVSRRNYRAFSEVTPTMAQSIAKLGIGHPDNVLLVSADLDNAATTCDTLVSLALKADLMQSPAQNRGTLRIGNGALSAHAVLQPGQRGSASSGTQNLLQPYDPYDEQQKQAILHSDVRIYDNLEKKGFGELRQVRTAGLGQIKAHIPPRDDSDPSNYGKFEIDADHPLLSRMFSPQQLHQLKSGQRSYADRGTVGVDVNDLIVAAVDELSDMRSVPMLRSQADGGPRVALCPVLEPEAQGALDRIMDRATPENFGSKYERASKFLCDYFRHVLSRDLSQSALISAASRGKDAGSRLERVNETLRALADRQLKSLPAGKYALELWLRGTHRRVTRVGGPIASAPAAAAAAAVPTTGDAAAASGGSGAPTERGTTDVDVHAESVPFEDDVDPDDSVSAVGAAPAALRAVNAAPDPVQAAVAEPEINTGDAAELALADQLDADAGTGTPAAPQSHPQDDFEVELEQQRTAQEFQPGWRAPLASLARAPTAGAHGEATETGTVIGDGV